MHHNAKQVLYVSMYRSSSLMAEYGSINRILSPILLMVSCTVPFEPENMVPRDRFGRPVPDHSAHSPHHPDNRLTVNPYNGLYIDKKETRKASKRGTYNIDNKQMIQYIALLEERSRQTVRGKIDPAATGHK